MAVGQPETLGKGVQTNAGLLPKVPNRKGDEERREGHHEERQAGDQGVCPVCGTKMYKIGKS